MRRTAAWALAFTIAIGLPLAAGLTWWMAAVLLACRAV